MLDKQRTYMILNYDTSPVAVTTRTTNELVPAGSDDVPSGLPMSIEEIRYINSTTNIFKIGRLRFEPEFEEEIYEELRIRDWRDILSNQQIYDIILNPTTDGLERLLAIDDQMYFDRVYGAFIGLMNTGINISGNVESVIRARYAELMRNKRKTEIKIRPKQAEVTETDAKVEELQRQLEEMRAMLAQAMSGSAAPSETEPEESKAAKPKTKAPAKKRTTAAKTTETENE